MDVVRAKRLPLFDLNVRLDDLQRNLHKDQTQMSRLARRKNEIRSELMKGSRVIVDKRKPREKENNEWVNRSRGGQKSPRLRDLDMDSWLGRRKQTEESPRRRLRTALSNLGRGRHDETTRVQSLSPLFRSRDEITTKQRLRTRPEAISTSLGGGLSRLATIIWSKRPLRD